jgi:hypothetical protein
MSFETRSNLLSHFSSGWYIVWNQRKVRRTDAPPNHALTRCAGRDALLHTTFAMPLAPRRAGVGLATGWTVEAR